MLKKHPRQLYCCVCVILKKKERMKERFLSSPQISHMIRLFQKATDEIWVEDGSHPTWKAVEGCFQSELIQWDMMQPRWPPGSQPR